MTGAELLTRGSIWLALCAYAAGASMRLRARGRMRWLVCARWAWTAGCLLFLAHVACAFAFYHHWSHAEAYADTARQTAELTGWHWGGGLYLNYLFALAWIADVLWQWRVRGSSDGRPHWLASLWQGFFTFMVFNATVVFGKGPVRWLGIAICLGLGFASWQRKRGATSADSPA